MELPSPKDMPCELCRKWGSTSLRSAPLNDFQSEYGTPEDLRKRPDCPLCRLILKMLPADKSAMSNTATTSPRGLLTVTGGLNEGIRVFSDGTYHGLIVTQRPVNSLPGTESPKSEMPHLIKEWVKKCEDCHLDDLQLAPRYKQPIEIVLVDVLDQKLVRASSSWRYLTLSYVWGTAFLETTTTANRGARGEYGALSKFALPQSISDAILLVSQLGERYLWVDFLCIEQDNPAQKHGQISQMDVIYSQGLLTLVALSPKNADSFLPGVQRGTLSPIKAKDFAFGKDIYALYPRLLDYSEATVYESRGWTFQERLLSRRCLFLTDYDMYYTCHDSMSYHTAINSTEGERSIFKRKFQNIFATLDYIKEYHNSPSLPRWTTIFSLYASLVHEYSKRDLSYDTDAINAFSGIGAVIGHCLISRPLSGLIECILDACLLWVPRDRNTHCRNPNFPSWSWAGWKGEVLYLSGPLYKYAAAYPTEQILLRSLVDRFDTSRPILRLKHDCSDIPTAAIGKEESETPTKQIDLLSFEADTADVRQLSLSGNDFTVRGDLYVGPFESHSCSVRILKILDADNIACGYLHCVPQNPHTEAQKHRELVALSRSQYPLCHPAPMMAVLDGSSQTESYEVLFDHGNYKWGQWCLLNIMLIAWKGGEAERITIGQMHIVAWMRLKKARKQIRLV